jgi:hypothetical protein
MITITLVDAKSFNIVTSYEVDSIEQACQALEYWHTQSDVRAVSRINLAA